MCLRQEAERMRVRKIERKGWEGKKGMVSKARPESQWEVKADHL